MQCHSIRQNDNIWHPKKRNGIRMSWLPRSVETTYECFQSHITFKDQQKPYLDVELVCIHSVFPFMHHKKDHGFSWHEALHNINMLKGKCFLSTTGLSSTFIRHHDNTITFLKRSDISSPLTWLEVTCMLFTPLFPPAQCFSYEVAAERSVPFSFSFFCELIQLEYGCNEIEHIQ